MVTFVLNADLFQEGMRELPRKLRTFVTQVGFFDLAVAAPSMKAALEAWGMKRNAFDQGFAHEADDPRIIAAANARPGIVLKRAVGTKGEYTENAELPKDLPADTPSRPERPTPKKAQKLTPAVKPSEAADRAAIVSFEREKLRLARDRARQAEAEQRRHQERRRKTGKAEAALETARQRHAAASGEIEREQEKLERRADAEEQRWRKERETLAAAIRKAKE
jgi:hypothetical protein